MRAQLSRAALNLSLLVLFTVPLRANVSLPAIFSEHAVLQKSDRVPIWGKGEVGEAVTVTVDKATASAKTGSDGKWKVELNLKDEGHGPYELIVQGVNKLTIADVVLGEVWVCSGQSNMEFTLDKAIGAKEEIDQPSNPLLRQFNAAHIASPTPQDDNPGRWEIASRETKAHFSAVGYFFGKRLQSALKIPVGLLHTSWGGTPSEAWTSSESLDTVSDLKKGKAHAISDIEQLQNYSETYAAWTEEHHRKDHPLPASIDSYIKTDAPLNDWKVVKLPAKFSDIGLPDAGAVWLRKQITLPPEVLKLVIPFKFGEFRDNLTVFWNEKKIFQLDPSGIGHAQSAWAAVSHNTLVIRIANPSTGMGILPGREFSVADKIPLEGEWLAKVEYELPPLDTEAQTTLPQLPSISRPISKQSIATFLYNGMIHPFIPYGIADVIWYQGETNAERAFQYRTSFPLLISDWRKQWGRGDFPFYFCQLANFMGHRPAGDSAWAELREAQSMTQSLPNTGQAILIDLGEEGDIHPRDKKDVGERVSFIALAKTYGKEVLFSGPTYEGMTIEEGRIRVKFKNTDGGFFAKALPAAYAPKSLQPDRILSLVRNSPDSEVEGFAICGDDHIWVWANAKIDGSDVIVSGKNITKPVAVRYAWADNPICNLYNKAGLPAGPFRTDNFPCSTENRRY
jgi:sialate O-acetylesterase